MTIQELTKNTRDTLKVSKILEGEDAKTTEYYKAVLDILEHQEPWKPIEQMDIHNAEYLICRRCGKRLNRKRMNEYCNCGQKIDWTEERMYEIDKGI